MLNQNILRGFTGTESYTRHTFGYTLTDGARYVAENGGTGNGTAWWLMDLIASLSFDKRASKEPFQVFNLQKIRDKEAVVTVEDGNERIIYRQEIPYTDFDFSGAICSFCGALTR